MARKPACVIRRATAADRDALAQLWRVVDDLHARLVPEFFQRSARREAMIDEALEGGNQVVFVAEAGGELVGLVHVELYDTPPMPIMVARRRAHIDDVVVAAAHRRRGIGKRLMEAASSWADERGATQMVLTVWRGNSAAVRFYRALGWEDLSRVMKRDLR